LTNLSTSRTLPLNFNASQAGFMTLGLTIRNRREALGMTLRDCALSIGINFTLLSRYERGERSPSAGDVERLAVFLGVSPQQLQSQLTQERAPSRDVAMEQPRFLSLSELERTASADRTKALHLLGRDRFQFPRDRADIPSALFDLQVIYDEVVPGGNGSRVFAALFPAGSYYRAETGVVAVATLAVHAKTARRKTSEETMTFHVLHELGHYRLHWLTGTLRTPARQFAPVFCSSGDTSPHEFQANAYAAAFLMPRAEVAAYLGERRSVTDTEVRELCRYFFVEPWTLRKRLGVLGIRVPAKSSW